MPISANQLKPGMVINYDNKLWVCLQSVHKTPGNLRAFVQAKLRDVQSGSQKEFRFSSTETLERVSLIEREMQYLYNDGEFYHFMDVENFEQIQLTSTMMGDTVNYLLPESKVKVTFHEEKALGVALPPTMIFKVIEADPGMKTATATASYKNAKIETGMNVQVPQFIDAGEKIVVDTTTGEYMERSSMK